MQKHKNDPSGLWIFVAVLIILLLLSAKHAKPSDDMIADPIDISVFVGKKANNVENMNMEKKCELMLRVILNYHDKDLILEKSIKDNSWYTEESKRKLQTEQLIIQNRIRFYYDVFRTGCVRRTSETLDHILKSEGY